MMMVLIHAEERGGSWHVICSGSYGGEGCHGDRGEELHDNDGGTWSYLFIKKLIIHLATVYLLLGSPQILPPMFPKASFMIVEERLMMLMNINSSVGYNNRLFMESLYFMKIFTSLLLKMYFLDECITFCLLFCLFLFSPILIHQSVLSYFSSSEVESWTRIRVPHGGFII